MNNKFWIIILHSNEKSVTLCSLHSDHEHLIISYEKLIN